MVNIINIPTLDLIPKRDYREVYYLRGDVREIARMLGVTPFECSNDLGPYLLVPLIIDDIAVQLVGLVPFIEAQIAVVADRNERAPARIAAKALFEELGYPVIEFIDPYAND